MLTTMGHGGEGQRIRDEILEIMHRHRIKEVPGPFLEQWHQKMHNNSTPDDIVICDAYRTFLHGDGDVDAFYQTLESQGVTRQRLESFERPITATPDFYPDKKDAMIRDFEHFLETLKSVHSATDLKTRIQAARHCFDANMQQLADFIQSHRDVTSGEMISLVEKVTEMRHLVTTHLQADVSLTELLCLDIAMEDFVRTLVERSIQSETDHGMINELLTLVMPNFLMANEAEDISLSLVQWESIRKRLALDPDLILQAESILERIELAAGDYAIQCQTLFQPWAEFLGKSFNTEPWTIRLLSEEVIRGGLVFALSVLCQRLRRLVRQKADLSPWQLISRGRRKGRVAVTDSLEAFQGRRFDTPVIIVSDSMRGEDDFPKEVVAVLTRNSVDVVSHVAIRARNRGVLLATCFDGATFEKLRSWEGCFVDVRVDPSGDVRLEPAENATAPFEPAPKIAAKATARFTEPPDAPYAVSSEDFRPGWVGGKSLHLKQLQTELPDWIQLPVSVALPFGTLGRVLGTEANRNIRKRYEWLLSQVDTESNVLSELRRTVTELVAPDGLRVVLQEIMEKAGLPLMKNTEGLWECIKRVWASMWNDRAYWNRKAFGIPHENLSMAVLIQEAIPSMYAYTIHTAHPLAENTDILYAEVVLGLGETLAGNYPGRAMGFSYNKKSGDIRVMTYPSKSIGLYGGGLICRSDANAEDLTGYAGAGLYSSFFLNPPEKVHLNYRDDPLVQDELFRREFLSRVGQLGLLTEKIMGSPQNIEGSFVEDRYYIVQTRPQAG